MNCVINGKAYEYIPNAMTIEDKRNSYFKFANEVFGLHFETWFATGCVDSHYVPYVLMDGDRAVSSVGLCVTDMKWGNQIKRCAQISTVMTDPEYRGRGLNRWLMEVVLDEWKSKCDMIYLYANDSVINFYPRFGFIKAAEYQSNIGVQYIQKSHFTSRKLDMTKPENISLLVERFACSNPFASLTMMDNVSLVVFHCTSFMKNNVYFIDEYNAIVVGKQEGDVFVCYDIFTDEKCTLLDILGVMVGENIKSVSFGFTPVPIKNSTTGRLNEEDTTVFVLGDKANLFAEEKVIFPFISRA